MQSISDTDMEQILQQLKIEAVVDITVDNVKRVLKQMGFNKYYECVSDIIDRYIDFKRDDKFRLEKETLLLRLKCFLYDLKHFTEQAQRRLENYGGEYYLSYYYFSAEEVYYLLSFPNARQSLQEVITAHPTRLCTSHDLAPVIEKIYTIRKGFEKERSFVIYYKNFCKKELTKPT